MPRRSLAVLIVALLPLAACSSGSSGPKAAPGVTGTSAVKGDLVLDVVGADLVSSEKERAPLAEPVERRIERVLQRTFDATVVRPLRSGRAGDVRGVFTSDALEHATGVDRGAVFDEGFAPLRRLVGTKTDVLLTALAGDDGSPAFVVAKIDWDVRSADRVLQVHRVGELTLVPAFGSWFVGAYTMLVNRVAGGKASTTTAVSK